MLLELLEDNLKVWLYNLIIMKGMTYTADFSTPLGNTVNIPNMKMIDLIPKIHELIIEHYKLNIPISKYMVYNLISRLLKQMIKVNID